MIDASRPVRVGIEGTAQLCAIVVRRQCCCACLLVRQRPELILNFLRDRIDALWRDTAVGKVLVVVERIANRDSRKAPTAPDFQRNSRIDGIQDIASARCFEGIKEKGLIVSVVDSRHDNGTTDAAARVCLLYTSPSPRDS